MANAADELPCPGCGFLVYGPEAYGSYGICQLCDWEDCPVQLANPLDAGGPNRESLVVYQARSVERWPLEVREVANDGETYVRDRRWRPLSPAEIAYFGSATEDGKRLAFNGIFTVQECYWMRSSLPEPAPPRRIKYENLRVIGPALIDGKFYRVIEFEIAGGGHGMTSQVWMGGRWTFASDGPGCPRIMAAAPTPPEELIQAGVDCSPLGNDYDPLNVGRDDSTA